MDRRTSFVSFGCLFAGLIFLLISVYIMPISGIYSRTEILLTILVSLIAMLAGSASLLIDGKSYEKKVISIYHALDKSRLVRVNGYFLFAVIFLLSIVFSAFFVKKEGDFLIFYSVSAAIIIILVLLQYHKAFPALRKSLQK